MNHAEADHRRGHFFENMDIVRSRRNTILVASVLSFSLVLAGCTQARYASSPAPSRSLVETVAFTSMKDRETIVDHALSSLIASNFSITLANDRLGLIQTDYVSILTVQQALADSLKPAQDLENLLMKVSVNAQASNEAVFVQVKGTFQRINGNPKSSDNLIGLYWLEQLAGQMAGNVEAPFVHQLTDSTYAQLVREEAVVNKNKNNSGLRGAIKVSAVLLAVLFAVTLAAGAFGPTTTVPTTN